MTGCIPVKVVKGVVRDERGKEIAGPGDTLHVDHLMAERLVGEGTAVYPPRK